MCSLFFSAARDGTSTTAVGASAAATTGAARDGAATTAVAAPVAATKGAARDDAATMVLRGVFFRDYWWGILWWSVRIIRVEVGDTLCD